MATLLLGLMALSLSFTVTLDSLAARHVQEAALAEGQAEAALALAAAEAATDVLAAAGALDGVQRLGPWPDAGVEGSADVTLEAERIIRVSAHASVGRSSVRRSVAFELIHDGSVRLLARP